jgi:hypothetical protein
VAIIDSRCTENIWQGQNPIGKQIRTHAESSLRTIIGIAASVKTNIFAESNNCQSYVPFWGNLVVAHLIIRINGNQGLVLAQARSMVSTLTPKVEISDMASFYNLYALRDNQVADATTSLGCVPCR